MITDSSLADASLDLLRRGSAIYTVDWTDHISKALIHYLVDSTILDTTAI